ncbi:MAG: globin [Chloroflexota bacterium]
MNEQPASNSPAGRAPAQRQPALLDRIGGREVIERIVEAFYNLVEADAELRALFPEDLRAGREKQALFMEQWLGGEPRYSEQYGHPRLRMRHFPFVIDERMAGLWLRHMGEAFRAVGVGEQEMAEVFADLGPLARHMVNAHQDVPRTPLGDVRLT